MMKILLLLLSASLSLVSAVSNAQQSAGHEDATSFHFSYELTAAYDDNIRRAKYDVDIRDDVLTGLALGVKSITHLSDATLLNLGLKFEAEQYDVFTELDNSKIEGSLAYVFSFSSSFSASRYALKMKLGGIDSNSEMRTANTASVGLDINKWLTTTIHMTAGYTFKLQDAQSEVFDVEENLLMINFDVDLTPRQLIYFTYHYIDGEIVSSATPKLGFINAAQAIEPDDAFGGFTTNQFVYRIAAESNVFTLGYNAAISRSVSLDLSFRFVDSVATQDENIYYERQIIRASLLGRF